MGETTRRWKKSGTSPHFHSLMRPSQGHGDSSEGWNPEGRGRGKVVRSKTTRGVRLVPRWGRAWEWQKPPRQSAVRIHNFGFSYLGVPAQGGMSDWHENGPLRQTFIGRSRHPFVYPAPLSSFRRRPESRGVAGVACGT